MKSILVLLTIVAFALITVNTKAQQELDVNLKLDNEIGVIRNINGGTCSPVINMKMLLLGDEFKALNIPIVRLHDVPWFNENAVDINIIFRDFRDDPKDESNYDFCKTDDYMASVLDMGTDVVYRLGESIEKTKEKCYVNPPDDFEKWAEICCGIIRHYNEGWADGYHYNIKYWEIWNEPDGSTACWTGTPEQFYEFYSTAAKIIKKEFPDIMIGGPAMAGPLGPDNKEIAPSDFTKGFLTYCKENSVPLDFFSWHNYNADPWDLAHRPTHVRKILDEYGFENTESHLNEWNYIPGNDWTGIFGGGIYQGERRRLAYEEQSGPRGASFVANVLMLLQDEPIDVANFYTTTAGLFGMYSEYGEAFKNYYAFKAFAELLKTPFRVETEYNKADSIVICSGINAEQTESNILLSNFSAGTKYKMLSINVSGKMIEGQTRVEIYLLDLSNNLTKIKDLKIKAKSNTIQFEEVLPSSSVLMIKMFSN